MSLLHHREWAFSLIGIDSLRERWMSLEELLSGRSSTQLEFDMYFARWRYRRYVLGTEAQASGG